MKPLKKPILFIIALCIAFNSLVLPFMFLAFNENYYIRSFTELGVHEEIGISENALGQVTSALIQYIWDGSGNIQLKEVVWDEEVVFYNEKEQIHLEDIRKLISLAKVIILSVNVLLVLCILYRLKRKDRNLKIEISKILYTASTLIFASLLGLVGLYFTDFDWAFRKFHEIFFSNDLWLLDPKTDRLIQLMPLDFFINFTALWLIVVGICLVIYLVVATVIKKETVKTVS